MLDVQAALLSDLSTRTVVPLIAAEIASKPVGELNPVFDILGQPHTMLTQAIASIPARELRRAVANLAADHDRITRALDVLLVGF